jgi:arylsulfatase A-like enzyme
MASQAHRSRGGARWRIGAAALALAALAGSVLVGTVAAPAAGPTAAAPPNIVVVMTDDQTVEALAAMPSTTELIGQAGATFNNSFVSFPLCCPSRATFLTGQYAHNHRVRENYFPKGGFQKLKTSETLPVWLTRAGYTTGQVGKVMNGYNKSPVGVPPGWSDWHGEKTENRYYGYGLYENGGIVTYGDPEENPEDPADPSTYSTDVYTAKAVDFIERSAPASNPFFLWLSYNAPHSGEPNPPDGVVSECRGNAKPAERHLGAFADAPLPLPPSFGEADVSDKPRGIQGLEPFDAGTTAAIERLYRCELESLLAVDEGVEQIVDALAESGELANSYVLFTSDNGFLHGQHRIVFGKHQIYEESIRVPLLLRGPGIPAGTAVDELVANVDLSPTILAAAGAEAGVPQDGRSLLPIVARPERRLGREVLIDTSRFRGVRNARYSYVEHLFRPSSGQRELYDLERDPYQLESVHKDPDYEEVRDALAARLRQLMRCDGRECRERPRLELKRDREVGCLRRFAGVLLAGDDADHVKNVRFILGGVPVRSDLTAPFRASLPLRLLRRAGSRVEAEATLIDGRTATLARRIDCG